MPKLQRPLKVFISYASQDRLVVRELSRRLVGEGWIETWLDQKNLLPGQDWRLKIEEAVEDSDIVIICLSSNSVTKEGYVQKELRYAREMALEKPEDAIFLVPLRLDECEVPRGLRFYQWVDYFGEKKAEAYRALIQSLKLRYEQKLRLESTERTPNERQEQTLVNKVVPEQEEQEVPHGKLHEASQEKAKQGTANKKPVIAKNTIESTEQYKPNLVKPSGEAPSTDISPPEPSTRAAFMVFWVIVIIFVIGMWARNNAKNFPTSTPAFTGMPSPSQTPNRNVTLTNLPISTPSWSKTPTEALITTPNNTKTPTPTYTPLPTMYVQSLSGTSGESPFTVTLKIMNIPPECSQRDCDVLWQVYAYSFETMYSSGWRALDSRKEFTYTFTNQSSRYTWTINEYTVTTSIRFSDDSKIIHQVGVRISVQ